MVVSTEFNLVRSAILVKKVSGFSGIQSRDFCESGTVQQFNYYGKHC